MKKLLFILLAVPYLLGCATTSAKKFSQLEVGMSKQEVKTILGNPYLYRGAKEGQETWEYTIYAPYYPKANYWTGTITYWVTFIDDKLVYYGQPGDFDSSGPDIKKEITIKER